MVQLIPKFVFFCLVTVSYLSTALTSESIQAVAIITRHGDRAPAASYPTDPYKDFEWPGGLGALSPKGFQELYQSGSIKRDRFISLLATTSTGSYNTEQIYVRSSVVERCVVSAEGFLAAFLPYDPVPIHVLPSEEDYLIAQSRPCPKFESTMAKPLRINDPEVNAIVGGNSAFFDYLTNKTGMELDGFWNILLIYDTLKVQQDNGLVIPDWAQSIFESILKPLARLTYKRYGESQLTRIRGGALLGDILQNFNNFKTGSKQNILFYSGHDSTVISLLHVLDVVDQTEVAPVYSSAITVELHTNVAIKDDFEIRLFYFRNEADVDPVRIVIPKCSAPCSLRRFIGSVKQRVVFDYDEKCKI